MDILTLCAVSTRLRCSLVYMSLAVGISEFIANVFLEFYFFLYMGSASGVAIPCADMCRIAGAAMKRGPCGV
jgi:hypothetical protein